MFYLSFGQIGTNWPSVCGCCFSSYISLKMNNLVSLSVTHSLSPCISLHSRLVPFTVSGNVPLLLHQCLSEGKYVRAEADLNPAANGALKESRS